MSRLPLLPVLWSVVALALFAGASAFAEAPVTPPPKAAAYSPDLSKWIVSTPLSDSSKKRKGEHIDSLSLWEVYRQGRHVRARLAEWPDSKGRLIARSQDGSNSVLLPFRLNRMQFDQHSTLQIAEPHTLPGPIRHPLNNGFQVTFPVSDGYLMAFNGGEWGAALWWFSPDGVRHYSVCKPDDVVGFFDTRVGLLAPEGLAHLGTDQGKVLRLGRDAAGHWKAEPFAELGSAPRAATLDCDGQLVVITTRKLLRVDLDGKVRVLLDGVLNHYRTNATSLSIDDEGDIYMGAWRGVIRVHRHNDGVWRTQWLLPNHTFAVTRLGSRSVSANPSTRRPQKLRR